MTKRLQRCPGCRRRVCRCLDSGDYLLPFFATLARGRPQDVQCHGTHLENALRRKLTELCREKKLTIELTEDYL